MGVARNPKVVFLLTICLMPIAVGCTYWRQPGLPPQESDLVLEKRNVQPQEIAPTASVIETSRSKVRSREVIGAADHSSDEPGDRYLTARIEDRTLIVTLVNKTNLGIHVWELGNMWGDSSFYLLLRHSEDKSKIVIANYGHAVYGRHQQETRTIPANSASEFRLDLDSHGWGDSSWALKDEHYKIEAVILNSSICEDAIRSEILLDRLGYEFQ